MSITSEQISNATSLEELLKLVRGFRQDTLEDEQLMTELPTFGGDEPSSTVGVWSWDEKSLLIGTSSSDLRIVPRS